MQSGLLLTPAVQHRLCTGFALGWLFHSVQGCLHSQERRCLQQKVMRFAVGLTHIGTSSHCLTPASHSLSPPPARLPGSTSTHQLGTCWVRKGALDAVSFTAYALSGMSPESTLFYPLPGGRPPSFIQVCLCKP